MLTRFMVVLGATALLTACATATVRETHAPDGRKAYTLNCSGTARGWDKCFSAAGALCKAAGYDILSRSSENTSFVSMGGGFNRGTGGFSGSAVTTQERSMVIACRSTAQ